MNEPKLPFEGSDFEQAWNEWIQFRKESRFKKYVPTGLKKTFTMLARISNNDEKTAIEIINQSIENNYQGLFPLKQNNGAKIIIYPSADSGPAKLGTSEARIDKAVKW